MLSLTGLTPGLTRAEQFRQAVADHSFPLRDGQAGDVTISLGVATFPQQSDPEKLIKAADDALYEAKRSGRNRVCSAVERVPQREA